MMRETSIEAYNKIRENGLLSKRRWEVYDFIAQNEPCSINTILASKAKNGLNTSSYTGRIGELEQMGAIESCGYEIAPTGHRVNLWRITSNLPGKLPKKETKDQIIRRLQQEISELKMKLNSFHLELV